MRRVQCRALLPITFSRRCAADQTRWVSAHRVRAAKTAASWRRRVGVSHSRRSARGGAALVGKSVAAFTGKTSTTSVG